MRYTKYKTRAKIVLTGDDDLYSSNSGSAYKTTGVTPSVLDTASRVVILF
jgi:hypothetical protein